MTLEQIEQKAETFFGFPTPNKDHVTTTSAILFARECVKAERERCAEIADRYHRLDPVHNLADAIADAIRREP